MEYITTFLKPVINLQATGNKIKNLRKKSGFSVKDLQELFGFEYPQAIYAWEQGKNIPTIDNLLVLSKIFNCKIEEIVQIQNVEIQINCTSEALECVSVKCNPQACENCKYKKIA